VRYLEHLCFPSFGSSLYATCWKAKFQGKLIHSIWRKFCPPLRMHQRASAESFMEALVTANEFAAILRISRRKFDAMYLKGETPACLRIGRQRFWRPQDIAVWMSTLIESQAPTSVMLASLRQAGQQP
ncbi:helix-turn-helix transcriptional regulator, partial [Paraburkholderia dinghuensis]|uniref:helix-turn-helix transcriptional regulator n=1 Tax=Paraburkholderia dinghuensis TaxID=2305225 RepID=UPI001C887D51